MTYERKWEKSEEKMSQNNNVFTTTYLETRELTRSFLLKEIERIEVNKLKLRYNELKDAIISDYYIEKEARLAELEAAKELEALRLLEEAESTATTPTDTTSSVDEKPANETDKPADSENKSEVTIELSPEEILAIAAAEEEAARQAEIDEALADQAEIERRIADQLGTEEFYIKKNLDMSPFTPLTAAELVFTQHAVLENFSVQTNLDNFLNSIKDVEELTDTIFSKYYNFSNELLTAY